MNQSSLATVEQLMAATFFPGRPARSAAYQQGVKAKFDQCVKRKAIQCPYRQGTAELDAYFAGVDEGSAVLQKLGRA